MNEGLEFNAFIEELFIKSNKDVDLKFKAYGSPAKFQYFQSNYVVCAIEFPDNNILTLRGKMGKIGVENPKKTLHKDFTGTNYGREREVSKWVFIANNEESRDYIIDYMQDFLGVPYLRDFFEDNKNYQLKRLIEMPCKIKLVDNQAEKITRNEIYKHYYAMIGDEEVIIYFMNKTSLLDGISDMRDKVDTIDLFFKKLFFKDAKVKKSSMPLLMLDNFKENVYNFIKRKIRGIGYDEEKTELYEDYTEGERHFDNIPY